MVDPKSTALPLGHAGMTHNACLAHDFTLIVYHMWPMAQGGDAIPASAKVRDAGMVYLTSRLRCATGGFDMWETSCITLAIILAPSDVGVLQAMLIVYRTFVCYSCVHSLPAIHQPDGKGGGHGGGVL